MSKIVDHRKHLCLSGVAVVEPLDEGKDQLSVAGDGIDGHEIILVFLKKRLNSASSDILDGMSDASGP